MFRLFVRFWPLQLWCNHHDQSVLLLFFGRRLSELYFLLLILAQFLGGYFITCHSWLDWKAFENQFISKKPCVRRYPDYLKKQRAPQPKKPMNTPKCLRITRLKHSWEFPGFAVNIILVGRFAGKASNHVVNFICPHKKSQPPLPLRVVFDECIPCLGFKSKSRRWPIFEPRNAEVKDGRFNEFMFLLGYDRRH